jgi:NDP-sugar pyrophosphorylase family protein
MIPYKGIPLVDHVIQTLRGLGDTDRIFLCAGFKADVLKEYVREKYYPKYYTDSSIEVIIEPQPLGTGGALLNASNIVDHLSRYVMVVNGDCLIILNRLKEFKERNIDGIIYCTRVEDSKDYGLVQVGALSRIINFHEKKEGGGLVSCGWYIFNSVLFNKKAAVNCSLEYDLIPSWLEQHKWLEAVEIDGQSFIDLGTTERIEKYK